MNAQQIITVGIVDDHMLFRQGLASLLQEYPDILVKFASSNGDEMKRDIVLHGAPQVLLMDINMKGMDGHEATRWVKTSYPAIHVLAITMLEDELSVIKMLRNGAGGYILKESNPREVVQGIRAVVANGYFMNEMISGLLIHSVREEMQEGSRKSSKITERELEFLQFCCTELTYKEIADRMKVSPRTIDGYREELFQKLKLRSRIGLVLYALRNKLVNVVL